MKKILYIITKSNWGGAQRYVYDLATTIPKDEYKISVLTGSFGVLTDKLEAEGVEILQTNSFQRNINPIKDIVSFFKILKILRKEKPDIIHVNSSKIGGLGALAGRLVGTKNIIFTAHGWPFREDRGDLQKIIIKFLSFLTVFLSHKTICVSKIDFEEAENWPFCKNKVLLIHNGIKNFDLHIRDEARRKILEKIVSSGGEFIDEKSVIIGSIGELHKNKGYKYAIKAMNKLSSSVNDFRYIIMGEGEERLAKLSGGVAVIKVGASTETEMKYLKLKIEDAVNATKAAIEEGIVPGGGTALVKAMEIISKSGVKNPFKSFEREFEVGVNIVLKSLEKPLKQIAVNAGKDDGSVIVDRVKNAKGFAGYDAVEDKIVEDMFVAGIVDPVKVTRSGVQNATSASAILLTTEVAIADEEKEKDDDMSGGNGMMPGMM